MSAEVDFYLYEGDGNQGVLGVARVCWKVDQVLNINGREVLLVRIEPAIEVSVLPPNARRDLVGISARTTQPLDTLASGEIRSAIVWEVHDVGEGFYDVQPSIGIGVVYYDPPTAHSSGNEISR